ncbi:MAG: hypothetical protein SF182_26355 [Deltaproteobacteria bacterium]|nr:hypothetical protein [Deltaproteobacteria bacterium]
MRDDRDEALALLHSPRGVFLISQAIGILRKLAETDGQGDKLPPDQEIIARLFPEGSDAMVIDEATATLLGAALLWGSRTLEDADPPREHDVEDMRRLLTLFTAQLPDDLFGWTDLPPDAD